MLDQATAVREELYKRISEVVTVPKGVAAVFRPTKEIAILEIMQRTGCHVQILAGLPVEGHHGAFTELVLQGTVSQNSATLKVLPSYLQVSVIQTAEARSQLKASELHRQTQVESAGELETEDDFTIRGFPNHDDKYDGFDQATHLEDRHIHSVWSTDREKRDLELRKQHRDRSQINTILDFTAYVEDLTAVENLSALYHDEGELVGDKVTRVATQLVSLFTDPATSQFSTDQSTRRAYQYLAKHERIDAVRLISKALGEAGRILGPGSFDALLAAASRNGDLHNFELVLRTMRRHHIPNPRTWARFHTLIIQLVPHEANTVIALMRNKGLLQANDALKLVSRDTVHHELSAYIHEKRTFVGFSEKYSEKVARDFGRPDFNWLTADALSRMLQVLLSLGRANEAVSLMEEFRKRGTEPPDTACLNIFLNSDMDDRNPPSAIATLKMFHVGRPGALVPDVYTYAMLFMIAWRKRYYNMLRVIWRYACIAGQVSGQLRHRILASLLRSSLIGEEDITGSQMFKAWAGKFVVGISRDLVPASYVPYDTSPTRPLGDDERQLIEMGTRFPVERSTGAWRPSKIGSQSRFEKSMDKRRVVELGSKSRLVSSDRLQEAKHFMIQDLQEAGNCKPLLPLVVVLERALQRDIQWKEASFNYPDDTVARDGGRELLEEILLRGIRVPMRPGDCTAIPKREIPWLLQREVQAAAARAAKVKSQQDSQPSVQRMCKKSKYEVENSLNVTQSRQPYSFKSSKVSTQEQKDRPIQAPSNKQKETDDFLLDAAAMIRTWVFTVCRNGLTTM
ncbi:hypothetical protein BST61_g7696 [Cercospora zeina]